MGVSPPPEVKTGVLRMLPKRAIPPTAAQNEAPHPPPHLARSPPPTGPPKWAAPPRAFQAGRSILPRGPRRRVPGLGCGAFHPPASIPEWNVPASQQWVPAPLRPSDGSTRLQRRGGGAAGGSIRASGRNARSGTVTCRPAALRDPGRLRGHGPRLGAFRLLRQLQLHGRAHGIAAGQTGCLRVRPEQRAQPPNNNRRWLEVGGRGPGLGSRGRDRGRG